MTKSERNKALVGFSLAIASGLAGLILNCFPLRVFPSFSLLFGSAIVVAFAARRGPLSGAVAGALSTLGALILWAPQFPIAIVLFTGEGLWVGYVCKRKNWRPLYASTSYWLVFGCVVDAAFQHYVLHRVLLTTALTVTRSAFNGVVNALIAEILLIGLAYLAYRRNKIGDGFRIGLASTVGIIMILSIGLTATLGVAATSKSEVAKETERAQLEAVGDAASVSRSLTAAINSTSRSTEYLADLIKLQNIPISDARQLRSMLGVLCEQQKELGGALISDGVGSTIASLSRASDSPAIVQSVDRQREFFQQLQTTRGPIYTETLNSVNSGSTPTAAIVVPVRDVNENLRGFIYAWYKPSFFDDLARAFANQPSQPVVLIVDAQSRSVASSGLSDKREGSRSPVDRVAYNLSFHQGQGFELVSDDAADMAQEEHPDRESSVLVGWATEPNLGWRVIVSQPMLPVETALAWHNLELLEELLGLVLLALLVSNAVGNRLARPLIELERYALRLAQGDLAARPTASFVIANEANLLRRAFSRMADALENSWREQKTLTQNAEIAALEAQQRALHVAALNELGKELSQTFDLVSICRAAHRYIQTQMEASGFLISLFDEREQVIKPAFVWGDGREFDIDELPTVELGYGAHSKSIRTKSPVLVEDLGTARHYNTVHFFGTDEDPRKPESVIYLPLISFDRVVGTLQVQGYSRSQFQKDDIDRLMSVASQIAVSISNAMLFEQLRDAKVEWEKTFDSMSDGVFLFDENATLIRANYAGAEMEGVDITALVGRSCCDILTTETGQECFVDAAIKDGQRVVKEIVTNSSGRVLQVTIEPLDASGRARGSICVARDVTELRRAEEDARAQREFVAQLVEGAQEAIFTFERNGRVTWCNRQFSEFTSCSIDQNTEFDVASLIHPDDLAGVSACVEKVFAGANESYESRFLASDGDAHWFKTTLTPVRSNGAVTSVLAVSRDVTDERGAAEQLERANRLAAVGQLAAGVAHDFNNLLAPILGRAQLLKRQLTDANARRGLDVIEKAALDGAATVRRLQNFSRRHSENTMVAVEVDDLLRDVVELTRTRWRDDAMARGIRYEISLGFGEGAIVMASPSELREVFTNILINALDAMPDGGRLTLKSQSDDVEVRITIADTGQGMPESVRKHIFEPFFSTKGHAGNGLGLAVSYGIIERHQGSISVDSIKNVGSTFTICLPVTNRKSSEKAPSTTQTGPGLKLLVVDDDDLVRMTLVEILESLGHSVIAAEGGVQALAKLSEHNVDMVLTDLSMPEMDGLTLARHVREKYPHVKTVMVTGYGGTVDVKDESSTLVDAVLGKPFEYDEVAAVIGGLASELVALELA